MVSDSPSRSTTTSREPGSVAATTERKSRKEPTGRPSMLRTVSPGRMPAAAAALPGVTSATVQRSASARPMMANWTTSSTRAIAKCMAEPATATPARDRNGACR
jgi:hypothetical protein